jgi:hypothetical protein
VVLLGRPHTGTPLVVGNFSMQGLQDSKKLPVYLEPAKADTDGCDCWLLLWRKYLY